ncbi:MAG: hypothetical protein ACOZQL_00940 [Myxococcota bacterium]
MRLPALLLLLVATGALAAPPGKLAEARRMVDDLELEAAIKLLDSLEKTEGNTRAELLELYLLQGIAFGTLGKEAKTRDAFRRLLVLEPSAALPADLPPRVRTPFFEAKDWASTNGPLAALLSAELDGGEVRSVSVKVDKDVLRLAKVARFHLEEQVVDVPLEKGRASAPLRAARVTWFVELLSERRAVVLSSERRTDGQLEPQAASGSGAPGPLETRAPASPGGTWRRPVGVGLLGAGAVAAGVGVVFGLQANAARAKVVDAQRDASGRVTSLTQREAAALEASAQSQALLANVLFGVGGALAAAGVVLIIVGPSEAPVVTLAPTPGGVVLSGTFGGR